MEAVEDIMYLRRCACSRRQRSSVSSGKPNKVAKDHSYPQSEVLIKDKKHNHTRINKTAQRGVKQMRWQLLVTFFGSGSV